MSEVQKKPYKHTAVINKQSQQISVRVPLDLIAQMKRVTDKRSKYISDSIRLSLDVGNAIACFDLPFKVEVGLIGIVQLAVYGVTAELEKKGCTKAEMVDVLNSYGMKTPLLTKWDEITFDQFRRLYLR